MVVPVHVGVLVPTYFYVSSCKEDSDCFQAFSNVLTRLCVFEWSRSCARDLNERHLYTVDLFIQSSLHTAIQ